MFTGQKLGRSNSLLEMEIYSGPLFVIQLQMLVLMTNPYLFLLELY